MSIRIHTTPLSHSYIQLFYIRPITESIDGEKLEKQIRSFNSATIFDMRQKVETSGLRSSQQHYTVNSIKNVFSEG